MLFSSAVFLFLFLPLVLLVYWPSPRALKNGVLLAASLLFYAWGETGWLAVILASIAANYGFGRLLARAPRPSLLAVAVAANLAPLVWFKYSSFLLGNLRAMGLPIALVGAEHLPVGISFFTFHAISFVIDVYRGRSRAPTSPIDFALYIALFPQLIAGPIVRYHEIDDQIASRRVDLDGLDRGVRRFIVGLAKKMLLANTLAEPCDRLFALPASELTAPLAWAGALLYALQIYYDFSGYSDMAIGLGHLFGFRFPENFNHPYVARSVTDFWRRWHLSLSRWFRDYLYVPLGGNRRGAARTVAHLLLVFFLCGLWHGAAYSFVVWGLYHGAFLGLEKTRVGTAILAAPSPIRRAYALSVVLVGWVFFRAPTLGGALAWLRAMAGAGSGAALDHPLSLYLRADVLAALAIGVVAAVPTRALLAGFLEEIKHRNRFAHGAVALGEVGAHAVLGVASAATLAATTYNPFIYFRF